MAPALEPFFQSLSEDINNGQFKKALEMCDKILSQAPKDPEALKCKSLCLIHLDKFDEALEFIEKQEKAGDFKAELEQAYCYYKKREHDKALAKLEKLPESISLLHLRGQINYRIGEFEKAIDDFKKVLEQNKNSEILVNILAVKAGLKDNSDIKSFTDQIGNSSDLAYNIACLYLKSGDLQNAEKYLTLAEELCVKNCAESEYSKDDTESELAPIHAQKAYLFQHTNRVDEAFDIYDKILRSKPSDAGVAAVVQNNIITVKSNQKLFNAEKNLFNALSAAAEYKITNEQKKSIWFNRAVVYLKMGKLDKAQETIDQFKVEFPETPLVKLLQASLYFKEKKNEAAEEYLKASDSNDFTSQLSLAQLLLKDGKTQACLEVLNGLGDSVHLPGLLATRVKLFEQLQQIELAHIAIDNAVAYWTKSNDKNTLLKVLTAAAEWKFQKAAFQQAVDYYRKVIELDNTNQQLYIPKLVIALSFFDPSAAATYANSLPDIKSSETIDIDKLENLGTNRAIKEKIVEEQADTPIERLKKKKKKKKVRLPKNYNPAIPPDPERWLPWSQRTNVKRKRKNRRGAHQGDAAADNKAAAGKPGTQTPPAKSATATPPAAKPTQPPKTAPPKGKKGKKGKK